MPCFSKKDPPVMTDDQKIILQEMETLATFMDVSGFTICGREFGADAVIGLIPGIGDVIACSISLWIIMRAWFAFDQGLCQKTWCIMLMNVGIDFCAGSVPVAGDIFDMYWKANVKNINLVRKYYGLEPMTVKEKPKANSRDVENPPTNPEAGNRKG
jgi:Domain of unknown function (DUF4112)